MPVNCHLPLERPTQIDRVTHHFTLPDALIFVTWLLRTFGDYCWRATRIQDIGILKQFLIKHTSASLFPYFFVTGVQKIL